MNTQEMNAETSPHWAITGSANCLAIGTRLAEFEITGVVGEGGFGNVYLAFDHSLQRTVAIKEYMPVALASRGADNAVLVQTKRHRETFETGMNSFINEARLLAQFDHPALIKVYRFWEQNNTAYMAMRYYEGQTFKNIITQTPEIVTEAWLKPILKPILEALEVLYKIQILHRDISPDNIMIQLNGDAVLLDFGAARQILGDMTQALTVILKPGYAPVEQYAEDSDMKQGAWTDIYALSAAMYWAITKNAPPTSVTRLLKDPIELLQNTPRPGFSKSFLAAIDKGMAVKPEERPQTIAEFTKLLGVDKIGVVPAAVPGKSSEQKKAESATKSGEPRESREGQKSRSTSGTKVPSGAKVASLPNKKASNKLSWVLLVAGVVVAAALIYRVSHHGKEQSIVTDANQSASANAVSSDSGSTSTLPPSSGSAQTPADIAAKNGKDDASSQTGTSPANLKNGPAASSNSAASQQHVAAASATAQKTPAPPAVDTKTAATTPVTPTAQTGTATPEATQADDAQKITGVFKLSIQPWATIYVDGVVKGVSPPLKRLMLPEGKHQIRLVNPSFPDHTVDILVNNKKRIGVIDYDFSPH